MNEMVQREAGWAEGSEHTQGKKGGLDTLQPHGPKSWPSLPGEEATPGRSGEKALVQAGEGLGRVGPGALSPVPPGLAGDLPFVAAAVGGSRSLAKPIYLGHREGENVIRTCSLQPLLSAQWLGWESRGLEQAATGLAEFSIEL